MAGQVEPMEHPSQKLLSLLLVAADGRMIYADKDLSLRWGIVLPSWQGMNVKAFLACASASLFEVKSLEAAAHSHQELSCSLSNGRRLLVGVRSLWLTAEGVAHLVGGAWKGNPSSKVEAKECKYFLLSCLCIDHVNHIYRSAAEVKLRSTIGSIIAGFAHEVRNPLAAIVSLTEGVMHPEMEPETLRALNRIPVLVERIENLIKIALSYGRPRPPRASWHQLGGILQQSLEILEQSGTAGCVSLLPKQHTTTPIYVDREHIISVVTNLLQNAIEEAGLEHVSIRIILSPPASSAVYLQGQSALVAVDVMDRGGGIFPENRENIFEPFFTTKSNGTGLGLALARDLARLNDGDVLLLETGSGGSTFRLLLPAHASVLQKA